MPTPKRPDRPPTQDPAPFQRWHQLVSGWPCQVCGCLLNARGVLRPACRTCTHVHQPPPRPEVSHA